MEFLKKYLTIILLGSVMVVLMVFVFINETSDRVDFASTGVGRCNISVISVTGELDTRSTEYSQGSLPVARAVREANTDSSKALVLLIDSNGGSAPAAEEISDALYEMNKPTVTFVRGAALSGGYWIATASDHIVALPTSVVGNIGVTSSYLDETALNEIQGYAFEEIVSGEYKEVGNVNKPLTPSGKEYLQAHTDALFMLFKETVLNNRDLTQEEFAEVADAKFYLAAEALDLDLIDEVGGLAAVKRHLATELNVNEHDLLLCEPVQL